MKTNGARVSLESAGFMFHLPADFREQITISVEGAENMGKNCFGYSASAHGPVVVLAFDPGWGVVRQYWAEGREIGIKHYSAAIPPEVDGADYGAISDAMLPRLVQLRDELSSVISAHPFAIVVDTGGALYELVRFAVAGRLNPTEAKDYGRSAGAVNAVMEAIANQIEQAGIHLILLHRMTRWGEGEDEKLGFKGWKPVSFHAPWVVRCVFDWERPDEQGNDEPKSFLAEVVKSKYDKSLEWDAKTKTGLRILWSRWGGFGEVMDRLLPGWNGEPVLGSAEAQAQRIAAAIAARRRRSK